MFFEDDLDLLTQYYRLRGQFIYYQHTLDDYHHYKDFAPVLAQISSLCTGSVHDLGNGLNAIRGRLEGLSIEITDPEQSQVINQAKAFCELCGWRIYTLQEISPNIPLYPEPVNLPEFIPTILDTLAVWQPPSIQINFNSAISRLIVADYAFLLRLALLELLLNSIQAMPDGGQIDIALQKLDTGLAQIEIIDTGSGLPSGDPEQCFDLRFTTGPHCYGVGLHVARRIIEKHRGTLAIQSNPNQVTRVVFQLPIGNPESEWDDGPALKKALEDLRNKVNVQKQEIESFKANYNLPREQLLPQLAEMLGQLSPTIVQFVETGLNDIRRLLKPLAQQLSGETEEDIHFILDKCDYCDIILGNVRALDPQLSVEATPIDLNELVEQVVRLMIWRVPPDVELLLNLATSLPQVSADAALVKTALLNLVRNALDAAGTQGRAEVQTFASGETVHVYITNTGPTIPPTKQDHIFELDYTTRRRRAFGLGLYMAQTSIRKCNGSISVQHSDEIHTRLALILPHGKI